MAEVYGFPVAKGAGGHVALSVEAEANCGLRSKHRRWNCAAMIR